MARTRRILGRLDHLAREVAEPLFLLDSDLRLGFVNPTWEALTGVTASEALGRVCRPTDLSATELAASVIASLAPPATVLQGRAAGTYTLLRDASGKHLRWWLEFWPFRGPDGKLSAILGWIREPEAARDTTDESSRQLRVELLELRDRLQARYGFAELIGAGPAHQRLLDQVRVSATSGISTTIVGEAGTGKRLVASTIHKLGPAGEAPLIVVDCAAMPPELLERQLFRRSPATRPERLEVPAGASILLRQALGLPRDLQVRLSAADRPEVRLLATATDDPQAALVKEQLHPDYFYLLTGLVIRLAPLRDRLEELPLLAQAFLERANRRGATIRVGFSPEALIALAAYDWPGNLAELGRVVDAAHAASRDEVIGVEDIPAEVRGHLGAAYEPPRPINPLTLDEVLVRAERRLIERALRSSRGNRSRAAEILGISRPRLYRRLQELGLADAEQPEHGESSHQDH